MAYSPYARSATLSFNDDYTIKDSVLETIASLLDMEVKEFTSPITLYDGATTITKYLALPGTANGFVIYLSNTSSTSVRIVGIYNETMCAGLYYSFSSGTVSLYNISAKTKVITEGSIALIMTHGINSNGEELCVHFYYQNGGAFLKKDGFNMNTGTLSIPFLSKSFAQSKGENYVDMLPITYPAYDCNIDTMYCVANVTSGMAISVNDNIYTIISDCLAIKN